MPANTNKPTQPTDAANSSDSQHSESPSLLTRRSFAKAAAMAGAFVPYVGWSPKSFANQSANDRPRVGCIGVGGMGTGDAEGHAQFGDVIAVCDVDANHAARAKDSEKIGKGKADSYEDYRRVLERDDIDLVSIVTPDHWHVKIAVEALAADKHVFCQKPLTLTLEENQLIREACKKHPDLVFFVGTQQRSSKNLFLRAVNMVQKGLLGKINKITVGIDGSDVGGPFDKQPVPAHLNWDMWQGQTAAVDYIPQRCHGTFRWWYEYSGGKFTDWGAHHIDIALWATGKNKDGVGPISINGSDSKHPVPMESGFATRDDSFNASHDFSVIHTFDDGMTMDVTSRSDNGILFEGERGRIFVNRSKITGKPIEEGWDEGKFEEADLVELYKGKPFEGHKQNFYRCIREGGLPVSDVFTHVQAMAACHLTTIAARLSRTIQWDAKLESIVGDEEAAKLFSRQQRAGFEIMSV